MILLKKTMLLIQRLLIDQKIFYLEDPKHKLKDFRIQILAVEHIQVMDTTRKLQIFTSRVTGKLQGK